MELLVNVKNEKINIILKRKNAEIDSISFLDEHNLTEKLLASIDELLKKNKLQILDIKKVQVKSDKTDSFTTARIAKTTAIIINQMRDKNNI